MTRRGLVAGMTFACLLLGGCGFFDGTASGTATPGNSATPSQATGTTNPSAATTAGSTPSPADVDLSSASAVCNAFADSLFSGSPANEGQTEPLRRAAKYVAPSYQYQFLHTAPRLAHWHDWQDAGATQLLHYNQRYVGEKPEKGTKTRKYKAVARRVVPADEQGNPVGQTYAFVVYCTLVHEHGHWLVAGHAQQDIDPN